MYAMQVAGAPTVKEGGPRRQRKGGAGAPGGKVLGAPTLASPSLPHTGGSQLYNAKTYTPIRCPMGKGQCWP